MQIMQILIQMNNSDQVSVKIGISVYKQPLRWIIQCIDSCLEQTHQNIKIHIRADGTESLSDEDLKTLKDRYGEHEAVLCERGENLGTFASYKRIFDKCTTDFIAQVDADDWLERNAISEAIECATQQSDIVMVHSDHIQHFPNGKTHIKKSRNTTRWNLLTEFSAFHLRLVRTSSYHLVGGYDENLKTCGDYDLALKLSEKGEIRQTNKPLYNYRIHENNHSRTARQELIMETISVIQSALQRRNIENLKCISADKNTGSIRINDRCKIHDREIYDHASTDGYSGILVTGMHRSRTSWIAKTLHERGISMGHHLLPADHNNKYGYFEDVEMIKINTEVLKDNSQTINHGQNDQYLSIEPSDQYRLLKQGKLLEAITPFETEIQWKDQVRMRSIYASRCFAAKLTQSWWGWKDPRSTLLLNAWKKVCPGMTAILCFRQPDHTCESLMKWHKINKNDVNTYNYFLGLWVKYNTRIINFKKNWPADSLLVNTENQGLILQIDETVKSLWGRRRATFDQEWKVGESNNSWIPNSTLELREQAEETYEMLQILSKIMY